MDWSEQTQEMINNWSELQKKMWDTFLASTPDYKQFSGGKLWEQTIHTGQEAVENTIKAQSEWSRKWTEYLENTDGVPAAVLESASQFQEMSSRWEEVQEKLWANWFEMLKGFDISNMAPDWNEISQNSFKAWKESTQKILESQTEWMNTIMSAYSGKKQEEK